MKTKIFDLFQALARGAVGFLVLAPLLLSAQPGGISGTVGSPDGPVAGATVTAYVTANPFHAVVSGSTDGAGAFALGGLAPGTYGVHVDGADVGYASLWYDAVPFAALATEVTVESAVTSSIVVTLERTVRVAGRVTDAEGLGLGGIVVNIMRSGGHEFFAPVAQAETAPDGTYGVGGFGSGTYRVEFSGVNGLWQSVRYPEPVVLGAGEHRAGIDAVMALGGALRGTVRDGDGEGIDGVRVTLYAPGMETQFDVFTRPDGSYLAGGLTAGDWTIQFSGDEVGYATQYYQGTVNFGEATPVAIAPGVDAQGIDAVLTRTNAIRGRVTNAGGLGLPGIQVEAYLGENSWPERSVTTAADGTYVVGGLSAGSYQVRFVEDEMAYSSQWYAAAADRAEALPVLVTAGQHTVGVNAVLTPEPPGVVLWGRVTGQGGAGGLQGAYVYLTGPQARNAETDLQGWYLLRGLPAAAGFELGAYPPWPSVFLGASPVTIDLSSGGQHRQDFEMPRSGSLSGRVVNEQGDPIPWVTIRAYSEGAMWSDGWADSDDTGRFQISGLMTQDYEVELTDWAGEYRTVWFDGATDQATATPVPVVMSQNTDLGDVVMTSGPGILGRVTDANTGLGIGGVWVYSFDANDNQSWGLTTGADGTYRLSNLAPGDYKIYFSADGSGYYSQYYQNRVARPEADPVTLGETDDVTGIDVQLQPGAKITGTLTDAQGQPLAGALVEVYRENSSWSSVRTANTDATGYYSVTLTERTSYRYKLRYSKAGYVPVWYGGFESFSDALPVPAEPIEGGSSQVVAGVDQVLRVAGSLAGTVVENLSGQPLAALRVTVYSLSGNQQLFSTYTSATGAWIIDTLRTGNYQVQFDSSAQHLPTWYGGALAQADAQVLAVVEGQAQDLGQTRVLRAGRITGTVTDLTTSAPLESVQIALYRGDQTFVSAWNYSDAQGFYSFAGLAPADDYRVRFQRTSYAEQWFDAKPSRALSDAIAVAEGAATEDVDAALSQRGAIAGTVTDATLGSALPGATVELLAAGSVVRTLTTNFNGFYSFQNLEPGTYQVRFSRAGFVSQWYNGRASEAAADPLTVGGLGTLTANAALLNSGRILGFVRAGDTAEGLSGIPVYAYTLGGSYAAGGTTVGNGSYVISGLSPGSYKVRCVPNPSSPYLPAWYDGVDAAADAEPVVLAQLGDVVEGVSVDLTRGASLQGRIADGDTSAPIASASVNLYRVTEGVETYLKAAFTNAQGDYVLPAIPVGTYRLHVSATGYLNGVSDDLTLAPPEARVAHIPLFLGAVVSGAVTDFFSTEPVDQAQVALFNGSTMVATTSTDATGQYRFVGVRLGSYTLRFSKAPYFVQWYDGVDGQAEATPVTVTPPTTVGNLDAALVRPGALAGTVTAASGEALAGVPVYVYPADDGSLSPVGSTATASDGTWTVSGLRSGSYLVHFAASPPYLDQWYRGEAHRADANAVAVTAPDTTVGIDAQLAAGAALSGTVRGLNAAGVSAPLAGVSVTLRLATDRPVVLRATTTDEAGQYGFSGLVAGDYVVAFAAAGHVPRWHGGASEAEAVAVALVPPVASTGIDGLLPEAAGIAGRIINGATEAVLPGVVVSLYRGEVFTAQTSSGDDGRFAFPGLDSGAYRVAFNGAARGYFPQVYNQQPNLAAGDVIALEVPIPADLGDIALVEGGRITGTVTGLETSGEVGPMIGAQVRVAAVATPNTYLLTVYTDANGAFTALPLPAGDYLVAASATGYLTRWYGGPSAAEATPVTVLPPMAAAGTDLLLPRPAVVTGRVVDAADAHVLANVAVDLYRTGGAWLRSTTTDAEGVFRLANLDTGSYQLRLDGAADGYLVRWYDGQAAQASADPILVDPPTPVELGDLALAQGARIRGTVRNAAGEPLVGAEVWVRAHPSQATVRLVATDANGDYAATALLPGTYTVSAAATGYLTMHYDGHRLASEADVVTVSSTDTTDGIDLTLPLPARLRGTVTDADGAPVANLVVYLLNENRQNLTLVSTDGNGVYSFPNLWAGTYHVNYGGTSLGYLPQWHAGRATANLADPIVLAAGEQAVADATLRRPGRISGTVRSRPTDYTTEQPWSGVTVSLHRASDQTMIASTLSTADGSYSLTSTNLLEGDYLLRFQGTTVGFFTQWYEEQRAAAEAEPITLLAGAERTDLDAWLERPRITAVTGTGEGVISPAGQEVNYGTAATFTLTPAAGWSPSRVLDLLNPPWSMVPSSSTLTLTSVTQDRDLSVVFEAVPDLVVSDVLIPAEAFNGEPIPVTWTLTNHGQASAAGPWIDRVWLSADAAAGDDVFLADFTYSGTIAPGESITRIQLVTVPKAIAEPGDFHVVVMADYSRQVREGHNWEPGELNNIEVTSAPLFVRVAPGSDLVVASVTAPATAFSGQNATVSWVIANTGNGGTDAPSWRDRVFLSLDAQFDSSDVVLGEQVNPSFLPPGESYASELTVRLPQGISGTRYLLVRADIYNQLAEIDKANNDGAAALLVNLTPPPDLQVTDIVAPTTTFSGQPATVRWTVTNLGTGPSMATSWTDSLFLSLDGEDTISPGDILLGHFTHHGALDVAASYEQVRTITIPASLTGTLTFKVVTDSWSQVFEHAYAGNNVSAARNTTQVVLQGPDLEVTGVVVSSGQPLRSGHLVALAWTVTNYGTAATPTASWRDAVYLSTSPEPDLATAIKLGEQSRYGQVGVGDSYTTHASFLIPHGVSGAHHLFVVSNGREEVYELDFTNNRSAGLAVAVEYQPADLQVTAVSVPAAANTSQAVRVVWTVGNHGLGTTPLASWLDRVYVTSDPLWLSGLSLVGTFSHSGALVAGASYEYSEVVSMPESVASGPYWVVVICDPESTVHEQAETRPNNRRGAPIALTRVNPDLAVVALTAPQAVNSGQELAVVFTIENQGEGRTVRSTWYDRVVLSPSPSLEDPGLLQLGSVQHLGELEPDTAYESARGYLIPRSLSGVFHLGVVADSAGWLADPDRANNVRWSPDPVTVTFTPAADLSVTALQAPAVATSGQPVTITWTVRNDDASTDAGVNWEDHVYLSRDRIFDPSDVRLGWVYHTGGLAGGANYETESNFTIPLGLSGPLYVFVVTDRQNRVFEDGRVANNTLYQADPVLVTLPLPSDLMVSQITVAASSAPGDLLRVDFTVTNVGVNTAPGGWSEAVYLSPVPGWSPEAVALGRVYRAPALGVGASFSNTLNARVPGLLPGPYYVLVRADVFNNILESDESNNLAASTTTVAIDAAVLALGVSADFPLAANQAVYRRLTLEQAGDALLISLASTSPTSFNELYVGFERMPSRVSFDYAFGNPFGASQDIVIPVTRAGTYYILAYGSAVGGGNACSLLAEVIPFSVRSVLPASAGNVGDVTLEVHGARFTRDTTCSLVHATTGLVIPAARHYFRDSDRLFATFPLAGAVIGSYALVATDPAGALDQLDEALAVHVGLGPRLEARIDGHPSVRPGRDYLFQVNYGNIGDTDAAPPLLIVRTTTATPFGRDLETLGTVPLQFLAGQPGGVSGILRPGDGYGVPFFFRTSTEFVNFTAQVVSADDPRAIDWTLLEASVRPEDMDDLVWIDLWWRVQDRVGPTWGDYVSTLGEIATLLGWRGENVLDVSVLWEELFAQAGGYPTAQIGGTLVHAETGAALGGITLTAVLDRSGQGADGELEDLSVRETVTDEQGRFLFTYLDVGEYTLAAHGFHLRDVSTAMVGPGVDELGLVLTAVELPLPVELGPLAYNDESAVLATDGAGVVHVVWIRGRDLWHARREGDAWVDAQAIVTVGEGEPGNIQSLAIATAEDLLDGTAPGLVVTWQAGEGADSHVRRVIGRPLVGSTRTEWSAPAALTGAALADRTPSVLVTTGHRVLVAFQRLRPLDLLSSTSTYDDPDLYYAFYDVQAGELTWPMPQGSPEAPEEFSVEFSYELSASTGAVPARIPLIGGKELKYKTSLTGSLSQGCTGLSGSLSASKEVEIFGQAKAKFDGGGNIKYGTNAAQAECPNIRYVFEAATLGIGGSVEVFIPVFFYTIPGDGWFADKYLDLKIGPKMGVGISGRAGWMGGAFPGWPNTGELTASVSIGGQGEAEVLDASAKGTVSLMGSANFNLLPERELTSTSLVLAFDLEVGKHRQSYAKKWDWEKPAGGWWSSDKEVDVTLGQLVKQGAWQKTYAGALGERIEVIDTPDGPITVTTFPTFEGWGPREGTGSNYGSVGLEPVDVAAVLGAAVTTRRLADGPPSLARSAAGVVRLAWARELPADAPKPGEEVVVATLDAVTGTWGTPEAIPGSVGFIDDVVLSDDGGVPMVLWSAVDSTGMDASASIEQVTARLLERGIYASRRVAGVWSDPVLISDIALNQDLAVGRAHDGRMLAAWGHRPTAGATAQLLLAFASGGVWSAPEPVWQGALHGTPAIAQEPGATWLFFPWNTTTEPEAKSLRLGALRYTAEGWSPAEAFAPAALEVPEEQAEAMGPPVVAALGFPPAFPTSCCPPPKPKKPKPDPDPPPEDYPPSGWPRPYNPPVVRPKDPNDILGPDGFGPDRWIGIEAPIFYTIRFENDPEWATAPAQEVVITMNLDPDLDPRTFRVGGYGWADQRFDPADSRAFHHQRIDLTATEGYFVDVTAYVDVASGVATWQLTTRHPVTLQKPLDGSLGFLQPNDENGIGEGFVTFTVNPRRQLASGTVIDAAATIVFDTEAPIDTPPIFNTLDTAGPSSSMLPLPAFTEATEFTVAWQGADDPGGAGLSHFDVFVAMESGPFVAWLTETTLTEAPFVGAPNTLYHFFVRATDLAGQTEIKAEVAEASILAGVVPVTLTYGVGLGGTLVGETVQILPTGANGTEVRAVPEPGYAFYRWSDGSDANPRRDLYVRSSVDVVALFDPASSFGGVPVAWYRQYGMGAEAGTLWTAEQWSALDAIDSDGDGWINHDEYLAGTNPVDVLSVLRVFSVEQDPAHGTVTLRWWAATGRTYRIEQSTDLVTWEPIGEPISGTPPVQVQQLLLPPTTTHTYYRLRVSLGD